MTGISRQNLRAAMSACGLSEGEVGPVVYELTLTIEPARRILQVYDVCYSEGQAPNFDAELRAIAWQHPSLVDEFKYLPWPGLDAQVENTEPAGPSDEALVALSDSVDLTYEGGKNSYQEEAELGELVVKFARAVLAKYGRG